MFLDSTGSFVIESTKTTPYVSFTSSKKLLEIKGVSSPDNTPVFYSPVFTFLESIASYDIQHLNVCFSLLYFNSSSAKAFYNILKRIKGLTGAMTYKIDWFCDENDEDMIESVEDFMDLLDLDIRILETELNHGE
ncbi:MAG: DUF1987 domain-containing protein [Bacteroidota bacterium]